MKNSIVMFIIGLIIGIVVTSGIFIYLNNTKESSGEFNSQDGMTEQTGTPPERPDGSMKRNKNDINSESTTSDTTESTDDSETE